MPADAQDSISFLSSYPTPVQYTQANTGFNQLKFSLFGFLFHMRFFTSASLLSLPLPTRNCSLFISRYCLPINRNGNHFFVFVWEGELYYISSGDLTSLKM